MLRLKSSQECSSCHVDNHLEGGQCDREDRAYDCKPDELLETWTRVRALEKGASVKGILEVGPPEPAGGFSVDGREGGIQDSCQIPGLVSWVGGDAMH